MGDQSIVSHLSKYDSTTHTQMRGNNKSSGIWNHDPRVRVDKEFKRVKLRLVAFQM